MALSNSAVFTYSHCFHCLHTFFVVYPSWLAFLRCLQDSLFTWLSFIALRTLLFHRGVLRGRRVHREAGIWCAIILKYRLPWHTYKYEWINQYLFASYVWTYIHTYTLDYKYSHQKHFKAIAESDEAQGCSAQRRPNIWLCSWPKICLNNVYPRLWICNATQNLSKMA